MTDTRKEFEDWKVEIDIQTNNSQIMPFEIWQACQFLNDKRIQQLLAVIELQRQAINQAINDMAISVGMIMLDGGMPTKEQTQKVIDISKPDSDIGKLKQALAIKPEDVELVEVGSTGGGGFVLDTEHGLVTQKLYTIKTKE